MPNSSRSSRSSDRLNADLVREIREVSLRLNGVAYLIGAQGMDHVPPFNIGDRHYGVSLVIEDLVDDLRKTANRLEETE